MEMVRLAILTQETSFTSLDFLGHRTGGVDGSAVGAVDEAGCAGCEAGDAARTDIVAGFLGSGGVVDGGEVGDVLQGACVLGDQTCVLTGLALGEADGALAVIGLAVGGAEDDVLDGTVVHEQETCPAVGRLDDEVVDLVVLAVEVGGEGCDGSDLGAAAVDVGLDGPLLVSSEGRSFLDESCKLGSVADGGAAGSRSRIRTGSNLLDSGLRDEQVCVGGSPGRGDGNGRITGVATVGGGDDGNRSGTGARCRSYGHPGGGAGGLPVAVGGELDGLGLSVSHYLHNLRIHGHLRYGGRLQHGLASRECGCRQSGKK